MSTPGGRRGPPRPRLTCRVAAPPAVPPAVLAPPGMGPAAPPAVRGLAGIVPVRAPGDPLVVVAADMAPVARRATAVAAVVGTAPLRVADRPAMPVASRPAPRPAVPAMGPVVRGPPVLTPGPIRAVRVPRGPPAAVAGTAPVVRPVMRGLVSVAPVRAPPRVAPVRAPPVPRVPTAVWTPPRVLLTTFPPRLLLQGTPPLERAGPETSTPTTAWIPSPARPTSRFMLVRRWRRPRSLLMLVRRWRRLRSLLMPWRLPTALTPLMRTPASRRLVAVTVSTRRL